MQPIIRSLSPQNNILEGDFLEKQSGRIMHEFIAAALIIEAIERLRQMEWPFNLRKMQT